MLFSKENKNVLKVFFVFPFDKLIRRFIICFTKKSQKKAIWLANPKIEIEAIWWRKNIIN